MPGPRGPLHPLETQIQSQEISEEQQTGSKGLGGDLKTFLEPGWDSQVGEEAKLRGISNIGSQNGEHPLSGHDPGHPDWVGHGVPGAWFPHPFGLFPLSSEGQEVAMGTASLLGGGGVLTQFYPQAAKGEASPQAPVAPQ